MMLYIRFLMTAHFVALSGNLRSVWHQDQDGTGNVSHGNFNTMILQCIVGLCKVTISFWGVRVAETLKSTICNVIFFQTLSLILDYHLPCDNMI